MHKKRPLRKNESIAIIRKESIEWTRLFIGPLSVANVETHHQAKGGYPAASDIPVTDSHQLLSSFVSR